MATVTTALRRAAPAGVRFLSGAQNEEDAPLILNTKFIKDRTIHINETKKRKRSQLAYLEFKWETLYGKGH